MPYSILIADDHAIVRHGMKLLITELFPDALIVQADNLKKISQSIKKGGIDLAILDINMPGGNSTQLIDLVKLKQPNAKIIIYSSYDEKLYASRYLQAGANAYINKYISPAEFKIAIKEVLEKGEYITISLKEFLTSPSANKIESNPITTLTNREIEVAELLMQGCGGMEIAAKLNIESTTVSNHKKKVYEKLGVGNLADFIERYKELSQGS